MSKQIRTIHIIYSSIILLAPAACDEEALLAEDFAEQRLEDESADTSFNLTNHFQEFSVCAMMYEHKDFGGDSRSIGDGAYVSWIGGPWNDEVSSVHVSAACVLNVYEHKDFEGNHTTYLGSVPWVGNWWNDRISSYTCTCH